MTKSFEDFEVYQKGIQLAKLFFKLVENKSFEKEFGLKDQIKRAGNSISTWIFPNSNCLNAYKNIKKLSNFIKYRSTKIKD